MKAAALICRRRLHAARSARKKTHFDGSALVITISAAEASIVSYCEIVGSCATGRRALRRPVRLLLTANGRYAASGRLAAQEGVSRHARNLIIAARGNYGHGPRATRRQAKEKVRSAKATGVQKQRAAICHYGEN